MKNGICADLHFAAQPGLSVLTPEGITTRLQDRATCFDWIVSTCVKQKCKRLFVVGDVFDSRTEIPVEVLDVTCRAFARASEKLEVVVVVGNHDSALKSPRLNSTQALRGCATVVDEPTVVGEFACVPWYDDVAVFRAAIDTVSVKKAKYLLAHVLLEGLYPERGWPLGVLQPQRWKHVFLGDYHGRRGMAENVGYVGAPMQYDYRDAGTTRGFSILDTALGCVVPMQNKVSPKFHVFKDGKQAVEISKGDFVRIEVDDPDDAAALAAAVRKKTTWVEVNSAPSTDGDVPPRLRVQAAASDEDVLSAYVNHHDIDDEGVKAELVEVGGSLLKEARKV